MLQQLFNEVIKSFDCSVINGARTLAQQQDYFNGTNLTGVNPDKEKLSQTMQSKHLPQADGLSHAVDVAPYPQRWESKGYRDELFYFGGYVKGIASQMGIKIRYGGDFNQNNDVSDSGFEDLDHFELVEEG